MFTDVFPAFCFRLLYFFVYGRYVFILPFSGETKLSSRAGLS